MDDQRTYHMLMWGVEEARLRKCSSATTPKATVLKIEIEVTDPFTLSSMMAEIQKAMRPPAKPAPTPRAPRRREPDLLALPAPLLKITDRRNG